ncbi:MAG: hypothetical protein AB2L20_12505 [Mangrovibacterium sp.]
MKKIFLALSIAILTSCVTYSPLVNFVDYSAYNNDGMFLTESNSVNFDYTPVGSINVLLYSGYVKQTPEYRKEDKAVDAVYYSSASGRSNHQDATTQEALRIVVGKANIRPWIKPLLLGCWQG